MGFAQLSISLFKFKDLLAFELGWLSLSLVNVE